ncbi:TrmB family transcriptional regulator [bacterium]|nr:TrmB family transcriptional regulator [bacterium]
MDEIVQRLRDLGLNSYEAKVYLALLKKYPATGYEISQSADIPQSRAYDALKSLVNEKLAFTSNEKPQKYTPIAPKELTKQFKRKINSTIEYLEKKLPDVKEDYNEPIHSISGYETIINKLKEIIKNAKHSIYIEIWNEDFKILENLLRNAYEREVDVKIVGYNFIKSNFGLIYNHDGGKEIETTLGRMVYLVADNSEGAFGKITSNIVWTKNENVSLLLKEFIVHDMYLLDVGQNFPEQLKYFYGNGFKKLKEKILSADSKFNIH